MIQFFPIQKHKLLRFVDKDGMKGSSRQDIWRGTTSFGYRLIDFCNILLIIEVDNPFYKDFLIGFKTFRLSAYLQCLVWIWITDSKKKIQVNC